MLKKGKKIIKKFYKNMAWELFPGLFVFLKNFKRNLYWKTKFLKQTAYSGYVIAKLSKYVKISLQTYSDSLLQRIL